MQISIQTLEIRISLKESKNKERISTKQMDKYLVPPTDGRLDLLRGA